MFQRPFHSLLLCLSLFSLVSPVAAMPDRNPSEENPVDPLQGEWQFYKMVLEGQEMPPRDPRLDLRYEFLDQGVNRLYWTYDQGRTFCERKGQYIFKDGFLMDEIVWVNPNNKSDCASDVDMQLGRKSVSQLDIFENEIVLHIPFTDKEILYHWKKVATP